MTLAGWLQIILIFTIVVAAAWPLGIGMARLFGHSEPLVLERGIYRMVGVDAATEQSWASYTLASITAVVLGGTSLKGGRGTFIGTLLAAVLLTEVLNAISFLGLSQTYQYVFQGGLILLAALVYSTVRGRVR